VVKGNIRSVFVNLVTVPVVEVLEKDLNSFAGSNVDQGPLYSDNGCIPG